MYYAHIRSEELLDISGCKYLDDDITNIEVTDDIFAQWCEDNDKLTYSNGEIIENPDYDNIKTAQRKEYFSKNFFNTSLGWVRREVTMKDGSTKNFLSDLYPTILTMVNNGISIPVLVYDEPDYSKELTTEYMITLQKQTTATAEFVTECGNQLLADFKG